MKDLNAVQLIGRLGQNPDVQYDNHGAACPTSRRATAHPSATPAGPVP